MRRMGTHCLMVRRRAAVASLCISLALQVVGCASPAKQGPKARVGHIEISLVEKLEKRADGLDIEDRVASGIGAALRRSDLQSPDGSLTLVVRVVSFRLRGSETTRWLGIMAGVDKLSVDVRVQRGTEVLETFAVRFGLAGGSSGAPRTSRLSKLVVNVGNEVAKKLQKLDIRDPMPHARR